MKLANHAMHFYFLTMIGESFAKLGNERNLNLFGSTCVTVQGQIFEDSNLNGEVDHDSDQALSNVEISLSTCGGAVSQTTNSNSTGGFMFSAPNEGCYQISVNADPDLELVCPGASEVNVSCGDVVKYDPYCVPSVSTEPVINGWVSTRISDLEEPDPLTSGGIVTFSPCNGGGIFAVSLAEDGSFESSQSEGCYNVVVDPQSNQLNCGGGEEITSERGFISTVNFTCVPVTTPTPSATVGFIEVGAFLDKNGNKEFDDGEEMSGGIATISTCDGSSPARTEELSADGTFSTATPKGCYNFLYTPVENGLECSEHNGIILESGSSTMLVFACARPPTLPPIPGMIIGQVFVDANGNSELDADLDDTLNFGSVVMISCDENGSSADLTVGVNATGGFEKSVAPGCYTVTVPSDDLICSAPSIVIQTGLTANVTLLCVSRASNPVPVPTPSTGTIDGTVIIDSNGNCALDVDSDEGLSTGTAIVSACDGSSSVTLNMVDGMFTTGPISQGCYDITVDPQRDDLFCGSRTDINLEGGKTLRWRTICQTQEQIASCAGGPSPTNAPVGSSGISNPLGGMFKGTVLMENTNAPVSDGKVTISNCGSNSGIVQNLALNPSGKFFSSLLSPTCFNLAVVANGLNCGTANNIVLALGETRIMDFTCVVVAGNNGDGEVVEEKGFIEGQIFEDLNGNRAMDVGTDGFFTAGSVSLALNGESPLILPLDNQGKFTSGPLQPGRFYLVNIVPNDTSQYLCGGGQVPLDSGHTVSLKALCITI
mmetsp:Transcript_46883/g.69355  ORF Transcript_46883/g.69355 Transcript_46883/m.69355 type:complete len:771 (-) Transcript_46883:210-2522(-)